METSENKRVFQDSCQVCEQQVSKYRCPKCRTIYCSIECKSIHNCHGIGKDTEGMIQNGKEREGNVHGALDEEFRVPKRLLERIKNSEHLVSQLKSERLRKIILEIDGSESKLKELNNEMQYNEDFNKFIYEMLQEIGYIDANGQFTG